MVQVNINVKQLYNADILHLSFYEIGEKNLKIPSLFLLQAHRIEDFASWRKHEYEIDNDVNMNTRNKKDIMEPFIGPLLSSFNSPRSKLV